MKKIISFDLSSGDKGIEVAVKAAFLFCKENSNWIVKGYSTEIINLDDAPKNFILIMCDELVNQDDDPLQALRKKNSTLIKSINSVKDGESSGVISAAGSSQLVSSGYLIFKNIQGLKPAFSPLISSSNGNLMVVLDVGANIGADSKTLNQYAEMGTILAKILNISNNPKVMQLNIGVEPKKGTKIQQEAYKLMSNNPLINFQGNIESNMILTNNNVDVIVTEAFSGNIALKSYEGAISYFKSIIKKSMNESLIDRIGLYLSVKFRNEIKKSTNDKSGGAIVLGLNYLLVKTHGSADEKQFYNSLLITKEMIEGNLINKLKEKINE